MKKVIIMAVLASISFGSVYAHGTVGPVKSTMQTDTTKKKTKTTKKDSTRKKDSTLVKQN